jgi:hypothetical protein
MPRFSIKDLILATTLVAVGLTVEVLLLRTDQPWLSPAAGIVVYFSGAAAIGAGLLTPIHKKAVGVAIGIFAAIFLMILFVATTTQVRYP